MEPCHYIDPKAVIEGKAIEKVHIYHTSPDERFVIGLWECSPCKEHIDSYPFDEFMVILNGAVTVTDDEGRSQTFKAGDRFVMQKGWRGTWHMTEPFKKYFVIYAQ